MVKKGQYVIVAGFPRCGSTYLANILRQHPHICVPEMKEINYFNKTPKYLSNPNVVSRNNKKNFEWYKSLFDHDKKILMDFSILIAYDPNAPKRIKEKLGDIKIIFITREKEKHKESVYKIQKILGGIPDISYKEYLEKYDFYANHYSNFEEPIQRFKKNFSKVGIFNIIDNDTKKEIRKIIKFMGLKDHKDINWDVFRNDSKSERKRRFLQGIRRTMFIHTPNLHNVFRWLKEKLGLAKM